MSEGAKTQAGRPRQWATFYLGKECFALSVGEVQEVLNLQPLTRVPLAPPLVKGLLNLRGDIIPALDARVCLGLSGEAEAGKLMVLRGADGLVSILVDDVGDVLELEPERWRAVPDTLDASMRQLVDGVFPLEDRLVLGLSARALVGEGAAS